MVISLSTTPMMCAYLLRDEHSRPHGRLYLATERIFERILSIYRYTLHWVLGDVVPPDLNAALEQDEESAARERERLYYVAFTRSRDLLILPKVPHTSARSWTAIVQDPEDALFPPMLVSALKHVSPATPLPRGRFRSRAPHQPKRASAS